MASPLREWSRRLICYHHSRKYVAAEHLNYGCGSPNGQRNHDGRFVKAVSAAADQKPAMNSSCRKARSANRQPRRCASTPECGRILHGSKGMDIRKLPID
jgi:hypothetical protein